jgi:hypothetical protein
MSDVPSTSPAPHAEPGSDYATEAAIQDRFLDRRIAEIRGQYDAGSITVREALDARIDALEHHLAAVRALRAEYFGDPS